MEEHQRNRILNETNMTVEEFDNAIFGFHTDYTQIFINANTEQKPFVNAIRIAAAEGMIRENAKQIRFKEYESLRRDGILDGKIEENVKRIKTVASTLNNFINTTSQNMQLLKAAQKDYREVYRFLESKYLITQLILQKIKIHKISRRVYFE